MPLILSRYAGLGSHRYPLGFSGDTAINHKVLDFQPYFTANAANAAYFWWSHDIGGHHFGYKDDELYLRWIEFGVFSPILRLHSTSNDLLGKEPWKYRHDVYLSAKSGLISGTGLLRIFSLWIINATKRHTALQAYVLRLSKRRKRF